MDPADLVTLPAQRPPAPTFAAYIPVPTEAEPAGTRRAQLLLETFCRWSGRVAVARSSPRRMSPLRTGNLLTVDGRLSAVLDFGGLGVGDPACDLVIAWTLLPHTARTTFRTALQVDEATWARGRGWALNRLDRLHDLCGNKPGGGKEYPPPDHRSPYRQCTPDLNDG